MSARNDLLQTVSVPVPPRALEDTISTSVIGPGYVGAVSCGCRSALGHAAVGVDLDSTKTAASQAGRPPIHEVGGLSAALGVDGTDVMDVFIDLCA